MAAASAFEDVPAQDRSAAASQITQGLSLGGGERFAAAFEEPRSKAANHFGHAQLRASYGGERKVRVASTGNRSSGLGVAKSRGRLTCV